MICFAVFYICEILSELLWTYVNELSNTNMQMHYAMQTLISSLEFHLNLPQFHIIKRASLSREVLCISLLFNFPPTNMFVRAASYHQLSSILHGFCLSLGRKHFICLLHSRSASLSVDEHSNLTQRGAAASLRIRHDRRSLCEDWQQQHRVCPCGPRRSGRNVYFLLCH